MKIISSLVVSALLFPVVTFAAYSDVQSGAWYENETADFVGKGYLDPQKTMFYPSDDAKRAEFVKLLVEVSGLDAETIRHSFDDVSTRAWYYPYFEVAAENDWIRGDGDCYGFRPCMARPDESINRAEAAALLVRTFDLVFLGKAPEFSDNPQGEWYMRYVQTAADLCILQGDDNTGLVRPQGTLNRAEMVVMFHRAEANLRYGVDCGEDTGPPPPSGDHISSVEASSNMRIRIEFSSPLDEERAEEAWRYSVQGEGTLEVVSAELQSPNVVVLELGDAMLTESAYLLNISGLKTADGVAFSDSVSFVYTN